MIERGWPAEVRGGAEVFYRPLPLRGVPDPNPVRRKSAGVAEKAEPVTGSRA